MLRNYLGEPEDTSVWRKCFTVFSAVVAVISLLVAVLLRTVPDNETTSFSDDSVSTVFAECSSYATDNELYIHDGLECEICVEIESSVTLSECNHTCTSWVIDFEASEIEAVISTCDIADVNFTQLTYDGICPDGYYRTDAQTGCNLTEVEDTVTIGENCNFCLSNDTSFDECLASCESGDCAAIVANAEDPDNCFTVNEVALEAFCSDVAQVEFTTCVKVPSAIECFDDSVSFEEATEACESIGGFLALVQDDLKIGRVAAACNFSEGCYVDSSDDSCFFVETIQEESTLSVTLDCTEQKGHCCQTTTQAPTIATEVDDVSGLSTIVEASTLDSAGVACSDDGLQILDILDEEEQAAAVSFCFDLVAETGNTCGCWLGAFIFSGEIFWISQVTFGGFEAFADGEPGDEQCIILDINDGGAWKGVDCVNGCDGVLPETICETIQFDTGGTPAPNSQPTPPTIVPTLSPTRSPIKQPSISPSESPIVNPTRNPTEGPSNVPTTLAPTLSPTESPTRSPSENPTSSPTQSPSVAPSVSPSIGPTISPTESPSESPTESPTVAPSESPSVAPTTSPTISPTINPTLSPSTSPTLSPSTSPTLSPSESPTQSPSISPTIPPTTSPTISPTENPTLSPTTARPSISPVEFVFPTKNPTESPSSFPTLSPTVTPTVSPVSTPTIEPTLSPSLSPTTSTPTDSPTIFDTGAPTNYPTTSPTDYPTRYPTAAPTEYPTAQPVVDPFCKFKNGEGVWKVRNDDNTDFGFSCGYKRDERTYYAYDSSYYPTCGSSSSYCPGKSFKCESGKEEKVIAPCNKLWWFLDDGRAGDVEEPEEYCKCEDTVVYSDDFEEFDFYSNWEIYSNSYAAYRDSSSFSGANSDVCYSITGQCLDLAGSIRSLPIDYSDSTFDDYDGRLDRTCTVSFKAAGSRRCGYDHFSSKSKAYAGGCHEYYEDEDINIDNTLSVYFFSDGGYVLRSKSFKDIPWDQDYLSYSVTADVLNKDDEAYLKFYSQGNIVDKSPIGNYIDDVEVTCCCVEEFDKLIHKAVYQEQGKTASGLSVPDDRSDASSICDKPPNYNYFKSDCNNEDLESQVYSLGIGGHAVYRFESGFYNNLYIYEETLLNCKKGSCSSVDSSEDAMVEVSVDGITFETLAESLNALSAWEIYDESSTSSFNYRTLQETISEEENITISDGFSTASSVSVEDYFFSSYIYSSYILASASQRSHTSQLVKRIRYVGLELPESDACFKYLRITDKSSGTNEASDGFDLHAIKTSDVCCNAVDNDAEYEVDLDDIDETTEDPFQGLDPEVAKSASNVMFFIAGSALIICVALMITHEKLRKRSIMRRLTEENPSLKSTL